MVAKNWFFWALAIVVTALAVVATPSWNDDKDKLAILWAVAGIFWLAPAMLVWSTWRTNKKLGFVLHVFGTTSIKCYFDGIKELMTTEKNARDEVTRTVDLWRKALGKIDVLPSELAIVFKTYPFALHDRAGRFAGLSVPTSATVFVGLERDDVRASALGHELGHMILAKCGLDPSEASLKKYADEHGVPY